MENLNNIYAFVKRALEISNDLERNYFVYGENLREARHGEVIKGYPEAAKKNSEAAELLDEAIELLQEEIRHAFND